MNPLEGLDLPHLRADLERVEAQLAAAVHHDDPLLGQVAPHLVRAGGKRVRPALTLSAAYATLGTDRPATDAAVAGAVAVELVHLGSLYHDDVIDEADTRRGVPSVNARWSNVVAILSGDFLLARASALAASLGADVAGLLATTIGELCRGQVLELQHLFDVGRTEHDYHSAIDGKTAALFATSCRIGAMVTEAASATIDALTEFGRRTGLCFQIIDDVLDLVASESDLGKPAGHDLLEGVFTLPVIYALRTSEPLRDLLTQPADADRAEQARILACADGAVQGALDAAGTEAQRARAALAHCDAHLDATSCAALARLVDGLVTRRA